MKLLPSYSKLKSEVPLSASSEAFVHQSRQTISNILNGRDPRLLLIVGPCSIHDPIAAKEFAHNFHQFSKESSTIFYPVMRAYFEKPRSSSGWKGFVYDPHLDGSHDIEHGLRATRHLLSELVQMEIPTATEFLDPITAPYFSDLVCWGSIGARTSSSQPHRQLASGLLMPIGFKNGVAGNFSSAVLGAFAASHPHTFVGLNGLGQPSIIHTQGNRDGHVVLRGGENGPNFDSTYIQSVLSRLEQMHLPKRVLIDCSHGNSGKRHDVQPEVFTNVIEQIMAGNTSIKGVLFESHLKSGNQILGEDPSQLRYGISITDPCLEWPQSVDLFKWAMKRLETKIPAMAAT